MHWQPMEVLLKPRLRGLFCAAWTALLLPACDATPNAQPPQKQEQEKLAMIQTPESIASEHRELHEVLAGATAEHGEMAAAAAELEATLAPHFEREEEIASPPLGLLPTLARADTSAAMRSVLPLTDALESELPQMLREHEAIRTATAKFRATADRLGKEDYVRFADSLAAHARQEEEVLYPAAILVGRYVAKTAPRR
jgi:hypothetical protein